MDTNMDTHVKVLGWLYIISGLIGLAITAFVVIILLGSGIISGDRTAINVLTIISIVVGGFLVIVSLPGVVAGAGLLAHQQWARILGIVLGILNLPGFPVGTVIGIYALYVLLDEDTSRLFARRV